MSEKKFVYADHAATTAVTESVMKAMEPYFRDNWETSSLHTPGRKAAAAVRDAKKTIADTLNCRDGDLFTSGGTEAINWD